mmetsp:Transcript_42966/g.96851  ORF Transcript_42966/g.96851 Transcript_42966/m.96851 type:complete len:153 (-) Transcript_42966:72-530(-)
MSSVAATEKEETAGPAVPQEVTQDAAAIVAPTAPPHGHDEEDEDKNNDQENLELWRSFLGRTWEWRAKKMLNSEWKTIELRENGTCIMKSGVKRTTQETENLRWQVADNSDFWGKAKGSLLIVPTPNGKPLYRFSLKKFQEKYPQEIDPSLH